MAHDHEALVKRLYGERCEDHDPNCCVCVVWDMHDLIEQQAAEIERLKEALMIIRNEGGQAEYRIARAALGDKQ